MEKDIMAGKSTSTSGPKLLFPSRVKPARIDLAKIPAIDEVNNGYKSTSSVVDNLIHFDVSGANRRSSGTTSDASGQRSGRNATNPGHDEAGYSRQSCGYLLDETGSHPRRGKYPAGGRKRVRCSD